MAKTDMERLGVFKELGYVTVGDPFVPRNSKPFNISAGKGAQMMTSCTKAKSGLQAGYFNEKFNRIMEGEAYTDIVKIRRKNRLAEAKRNIGKSWMPTSNTKKPSGVGNYYGCFTTRFDSFSSARRGKEKYKSPGRNFLANPGKKGTGFGYIGVTIGEYHKYTSEPYNRAKELREKEHALEIKKRKDGPFKLNSHCKEYFDENPYFTKNPLPPDVIEPTGGKNKFKPFQPSSPGKSIGGCKAGTFTKYPEHSKDLYQVKQGQGTKKKFIGGIFKPSQAPKSMPMHSVITQYVCKTVNNLNL